MGFSVVHGSPQTIWVPVEPSEVIYTGALVGVDAATPLDGVQPLPAAAGVSNATNADCPFGVVVGNNNVAGNIQYDTTLNAEYITQVADTAVYGNSTKYANVEGVWAKGDPQAMVEVAVISPETVIRGSLHNATVGVAPSVLTISTASGADGLDSTTGNADVAPVANFTTIYMRSGANRGVYRIITTTSLTAHEWTKAMKYDTAVGDTCVIVNGLRPFGLSRMQVDTEALSINVDAALTADYFFINVLRLDLSEAGNEYVEFQFNPETFCPTFAS